ncbi:MAG: ABC transporter permease [Acidobacteria bacterium]|nr:ABC transporter permease [Acidobacteriota bacterium]
MTTLRTVVRSLARAPLFTLVAVLSLALGIGANTAMFSLLDQILLRTLPVRNPHELVYLYHPGPTQGSTSSDEGGGPSFSYPMFLELRKEQTPFAGLAAARAQSVSLAYQNEAAHGIARLVSGNYFELLGVRPAMGRLITEEDDRAAGGHPVAVLSYGYWTSRFGNNPAVLNQTLHVNGYPLTVVGVAQKGFAGEKTAEMPDIFVPVRRKPDIEPDWKGLDNRQYYWISLVGRLKPGVTRQQAETAINVSYRAQLDQDLQLLKQPRPDFLERFRAKKVILKPGEHGRGSVRDHARQPVLLMMGMTLLVLLIACANIANLQLARAASRTREVAVRLAMGASRLQLIRRLLVESCLLAVAGGALGLFFALWTVRAVVAIMPPATGIQSFLSTSLDGRVLLFSLGLSVATGVLFGLFPALQASKPDLVAALKNQAGQISSAGSANFFRKALVTAQVATSLLLLISAGLFGKTLVNLSKVDLGMRPDHLLTFSLLPKLSGYSDQRVASFHERLLERLAALPGVKLASAAQVPAIAGSSSSSSISVEGYVAPSDAAAQSNFNVVGADYFRTLGIALVAGREFTPADNATGPKVAVVNEAFVRQFLPGRDPLDRRIGTGREPDIRIVGVVKDARYSELKEAPPAVFCTPLAQARRWNMVHYYLRTAGEPEAAANLARREVAALDPHLPIRQLKTMQAQIEENMFVERLLSGLTGSFAGLATLLAALGLYGVLAYNVARRTREIGIRMALGAGGGRVRGLVLREVGLMLAIGTVAGVGSAAAVGRLVQAVLYGMKPWDALVYGGSVGLLWLIALAAAYVPARRAIRVDPMVALRYE